LDKLDKLIEESLRGRYNFRADKSEEKSIINPKSEKI